jgi:hypothetical protein
MRSYAVTWHEPRRPVYAGKLELYPEHLWFEGVAAQGRLLMHKLLYRDIASWRVGREARDRVEGAPALVIERSHGLPLSIASVSGFGVLAELEERLEPKLGTIRA